MGIMSSVVLATMTIGIIYLVASNLLNFFYDIYIYFLILALFGTFVVTINYQILKSERKQSHCFALEILTDELCSSRSIYSSYSFALGCLLVVLCFITSVLWLLLQEKQRKFAPH